MMKNLPINKMLTAAALLLGLFVSSATWALERPQINAAQPAGNALTQSYTWNDGERDHTVWLNPNVVAEFNPGKASAAAVIRQDAGAKELPLKRPQRGVKLWQMNNANNSVVRGVTSSVPAAKFSPVFHNGPSSDSSMRALPGNVVIHLDPAWNQAAVDKWIKQRNMQVIKKLNVGKNIIVIKTNSGMEALDVANTLRQSGEVKAAYPDWWEEVTTR